MPVRAWIISNVPSGSQGCAYYSSIIYQALLHTEHQISLEQTLYEPWLDNMLVSLLFFLNTLLPWDQLMLTSKGFYSQTKKQQAQGSPRALVFPVMLRDQKALFKSWMMCCCWSGLSDPGREAISSAERFLPVRCNPNCMACNEIFQLNPISFNL